MQDAAVGNTGVVCCLSAWYGVQKYAAAAPPTFVPDYLRVVLFIVFITGGRSIRVMWAAGGLFKPFPLFVIFTMIAQLAGSAGVRCVLVFHRFTLPKRAAVSDLGSKGHRARAFYGSDPHLKPVAISAVAASGKCDVSLALTTNPAGRFVAAIPPNGPASAAPRVPPPCAR